MLDSLRGLPLPEGGEESKTETKTDYAAIAAEEITFTFDTVFINPDHKATNAGRVPFPGLCNEFLIHIIPRDGSTRQIIDQIQENQMYAHHGQEGQQGRCCQHRKHIAEVGGCRHLDILDHIGIGLTALDDALLQHHQVFFQQDDISRLLRYIHSSIHRNPNIGGFHRCGVVDPVPHKAHGMSVLPQNGDHSGLLVRRQFGKYIGGFRCPCQFLIAHPVQVGAKKHIADFQAHLFADGTRHLFIVAGEDFGGHTVVLQCFDSICGRLLRRIQEGQITDQHHITFILHTEGTHRGRIALLGNGKDPETLIVQCFHRLKNAAAHFVGQRLHPAVTFRKGTDGEHFFHGAFGHHLRLPASILHHRGQTAAGKVKGDFVYLHIAFGQIHQLGIFRFRLLCPVNDGKIHQILVTGLEITVEIGMTQHPCIVLAVYVEVVLQHHLILGQGTRFIRTEDINGAEILNGIEVLYNGLLFTHGHRAFGKAGGHDHGEHLRSQANGNGDTKQECVQPVSLGDAIDEKHQRDHHQHKADQHPGNRVNALGKAGFHRFSRNGGGHGAKQRMVTGTHCHSGCAAGNHTAAHKGNVCIIGHYLCPGAYIGRFFHRLTFAGQARLADKQVLCLQNTDVGGDHVTGGKMHDISHNQIVHGDLHFFLSLAGNRTGRGDHGQQFFCRVAASGSLYKPQRTGDDDHGQNNDHSQAVKVLRRAAQKREIGKHHIRHHGYQRQAEQDRSKRVNKRTRQPLCQRFFLFVSNLVTAIFAAIPAHCFFIQAPQRSVQLLEYRLDGIGCRILNTVILFFAGGRLFRSLTNRNTRFFLVHWPYLPGF